MQKRAGRSVFAGRKAGQKCRKSIRRAGRGVGGAHSIPFRNQNSRQPTPNQRRKGSCVVLGKCGRGEGGRFSARSGFVKKEEDAEETAVAQRRTGGAKAAVLFRESAGAGVFVGMWEGGRDSPKKRFCEKRGEMPKKQPSRNAKPKTENIHLKRRRGGLFCGRVPAYSILLCQPKQPMSKCKTEILNIHLKRRGERRCLREDRRIHIPLPQPKHL